MRDFPPETRAYTDRGADAPDTRSPRAFLWWMVRQNGGLFWAGLLVALIWMVPQTVGPWMVGRAIDTGIVAGDSAATTRWVLALAVVTVFGAASGIAFHTVIVREWLIALYGTTKLVTRKALQLGHVLTRRTPTGEVLSVSGSDGDQFGALMEITTRAISQLAAYLVVAAIVLSTSVRMGMLVLLSAPLLVLLGTPLLRPMQRWQGVERSRNSELTSMATDIVGGLRILRGIGGEETFGEYSFKINFLARPIYRAVGKKIALHRVPAVLAVGIAVKIPSSGDHCPSGERCPWCCNNGPVWPWEKQRGPLYRKQAWQRRRSRTGFWNNHTSARLWRRSRPEGLAGSAVEYIKHRPLPQRHAVYETQVRHGRCHVGRGVFII